ncbi:MAG: hypothetical protein E6Q95_00755 [Chitinophagaceae bacterium]|nr:MAG: hypothetical protein E6Q95_00755 [Chitinophagaceae bacterium]
MISYSKNQFTTLFVVASLSTIFNACITMQKNIPSFQWKIYDSLPSIDGKSSIGYAGPVIGIHNDMMVVAGGANFPDEMPWMGGKKQYHQEAFVIDINQTQDGFKQFSLPTDIAYSANCSSPLGIVYAGGENEKGVSDQAFLIRWMDGKLNFAPLPNLPKPLTNAAATCIGDEIYVAGGEDSKTVSSSFYKLNLNDTTQGWMSLADIAHPVSNAVLVATNNGENIYLIGGRMKNIGDTSTLYKNVYQYNIEKDQWVEKQSLPYALSAGTGSIINDDFIALYGGDKGVVYHKTEELIHAINREQDSVKKQLLNQEKIKLQTEHPGFSNTVLVYDMLNDTWSTAGDIHFTTPVTTTAIKIGDRIFIPSGEIKAGVRTPHILEGTIK